ncbi:MAG: ImmA/IrrE family metallo-endopeptidase [Microbacterium sp.]|jgi:hypothetical protein|nr:ImmA/IrrE family metallo-endopeptidase [Microbacterium sp.]
MTGADLGALLAQHDYRSIAIELLERETDRGAVDTAALANSPEYALHDHPEVELEYTLTPAPGCSVFGVYRHRPGAKAVILVHPSLTDMRDNFTILHEYGHHAQRQYPDWVDLRYQLSSRAGDLVEELVSDAFAAEALLPADKAMLFRLDSAESLRDYYAHSRASRAAIAMRSITLSNSTTAFVVAVIDLDGRVYFARSSDDGLFAPARGLAQPALAALASDALRSETQSVRGPVVGGLLTTTGLTRNDLVAELALDPTAPYAFVVLRSENTYGHQPRWAVEVVDCGNISCGIEFEARSSPGQCRACTTFRCPECGSCDCSQRKASYCPDCTLEYTAAEAADPRRHECPW